MIVYRESRGYSYTIEWWEAGVNLDGVVIGSVFNAFDVLMVEIHRESIWEVELCAITQIATWMGDT